MYEECVFLLAHSVHALLSYNRFEDYVIVLYVCHYAYTSSIDATAALVATTVLYFRMSNTLIVLTRKSLLPECFLRKELCSDRCQQELQSLGNFEVVHNSLEVLCLNFVEL